MSSFIRSPFTDEDDLDGGLRSTYSVEGGEGEGTDSEREGGSHLEIPLHWDQLSESSQVENRVHEVLPGKQLLQSPASIRSG
jgi:hypothetical protein